MPQDPIIIVDAAGTEHEFPPGFDPKKAGEIVRQKTAPPASSAASTPRDARGMPLVSGNTSDSPVDPAYQYLGQLANPETLTDFARLLTLPVDTVKKAFGSLLTMRAGASTAAATGRGTQAAGRGMEAVATSPHAQHVGDIGAAAHLMQGDVKGAALMYAAPRTTAVAGRAVQNAGAALERTAIRAQQRLAPVMGPQPGPPVAAPVAVAAPPAAGPVAAPVAVRPPVAVAPVGPVAAPSRPTLVSPKPGSGALLPDQKALNEAALALRREAYQATQKGGPSAVPPVVKASGKLRFTAAEMKAFADLRTRGLSLPDAEQAVRAMKAFAKDLPTGAEATAAIAARGYKS